MRILHISTRLILGGSQENTVLSCEGQARLGHDVHLAFGPIYGPEGSLLERIERFNAAPKAPRITTHLLPNLVREIHPVKDHFCFHRDLKNLLRTLKPDIVHTHSSKAGILGRWAAWDVGRRLPKSERPGIVHTIHGPPFMPLEGSPIARLRTRASNTLYTFAERFAAARCHRIVSVADAMTTQFLARGIGTPGLYTTVRSGMEIEPYLHAQPGEDRASVRAGMGFADGDIVVGTVARLAQHKGHDDLLDALADELTRRPNLRLLWVGDGWWKDRLVQRAESMGLRVRTLKAAAPGAPSTDAAGPAHITLTGLVPPERVPVYMRAMDILAHPSYREGLPRTVPQGLLAGACPAAYDADGTREICRDLQTGRLVPVGDRAGLRQAVLWLADHPRERGEMVARGRAQCVEQFSARAMVDALEGVYAQALALARA